MLGEEEQEGQEGQKERGCSRSAQMCHAMPGHLGHLFPSTALACNSNKSVIFFEWPLVQRAGGGWVSVYAITKPTSKGMGSFAKERRRGGGAGGRKRKGGPNELARNNEDSIKAALSDCGSFVAGRLVPMA